MVLLNTAKNTRDPFVIRVGVAFLSSVIVIMSLEQNRPKSYVLNLCQVIELL